jgi:hypothetical protein
LKEDKDPVGGGAFGLVDDVEPDEGDLREGGRQGEKAGRERRRERRREGRREEGEGREGE